VNKSVDTNKQNMNPDLCFVITIMCNVFLLHLLVTVTVILFETKLNDAIKVWTKLVFAR
jgi:hypothetical protein